MTVGELREILEMDLINDALIIRDYEDRVIEDIGLTVDKEGAVTEIRFSMVSGG